MAAFTTTPTEAGTGPSVLNIAKTIGAKIRDAAENAKEEREKAQAAGETPKKGSLFKSSLANQFNPIKSKKAKSNWAKQFSWNKPKDKPVTPPTEGDGANGSAKLKEFIAGGFTAILKDTGVMVAKLGGINDGIGQNLAATTSSAGTLTAIKETLDSQTDLRRKALEEAKYARAEKQLEKTQDTSSTRSPLGESQKGKEGGEGNDSGGGGPFDWMLNLLGLGDLASNFIPDKWLQKLNPFKKSPVTQGAGGKPPGPRMPGTGPKVTTSGGATSSGGFKMPGMPKGFKMPGMPKGMGGVLGKLAAPLMVFDLYNQTKEVLNPDDNLFTSLGDLGSSIYNLFQTDPNKKNLYDVRGEGPQADRARMLNERIFGEREKYNNVLSNIDRTQASEGGIVPSAVPPSPVSPMAEGGLVDNPTKTNLNPGDSVIPLNRNIGKKMFGDTKDTPAGETAVDTVGAMILGVASGMLGKTESGTAGDMVKQDIRKAAKEFGISNLTFTSSIGKGKFGVVDTNKAAKDFMKNLFDGMKIGGGGDANKKKGDGDGGDNPPGGTPESLKGDLEADIGKDASQMREEIMQSGARGIIDPTKGPWCAAYVNAQLERQGIKGSDSPAADSFENWGAPVDKKNIQYGDVIVGDYGGGSRSHVMFAAGSPKNGAVEIIGGNQGGQVTRGTIALDKIDYVRRAGAQPPALPTQRNNGQPVNPPPTPSAQPAPNPTNDPAQTNLPTGDVSPIFNWNKNKPKQQAEDGGAWWNPFSWGKLVNNQRNTNSGLGYNARYKDVTDPEMRRTMGLPPLKGYASGGPMDSRHAHAARLRAQRASAQRSRLGVQKVNGKWVNMGVSDRAVGGNPWWQVWNKKGATAERKSKQEALAKSLAARLNKQEAAKLKPKPPKPAPPAAAAQRVGPSPSQSKPTATAAAVITPPASTSASSKSFSVGGFGGNVPQGRSMAATFADFLYADLIE